MSSLKCEEFIDVCKDAPFLAVDTETNGENIYDGRGYAVGTSLAFRIPGGSIHHKYFPFRHTHGDNLTKDILFRIKEVIESHNNLITHNTKFDIASLRTLGINIPYPKDGKRRVWCTMLMAHLLDENRPYSGKSLDSCCRYYLEDESKKKSPIFEGWIKSMGWGNVPVEVMDEYASHDAYLHLKLFEYLYPRLLKEGLEDYWVQQKQKTVFVFEKMESRGVLIDQELCKQQIALGEIQMDEILEILGYDKLGPKALEDLLLKKLQLPPVYKERSNGTKTLTFDKEAMADYETILERTENPTAGYILAYRGWQKTVSSNYRAYLDLLSPDGRLRPNYKLHGTRTGRVSCEKPNLQQIPRSTTKPWNGNLKAAFIEEEDFELWEADYSQLELRLATAYGDVTDLKRVFAEGRDIFNEMSANLGMERFPTKTLTYTIQYGGGINRLVTVFGVSPSRAAEIRDNFYATYPGFKVQTDNAKKLVLHRGKLQLWSGRYRHFVDRSKGAHKGFNSVIQGGAADIVERSMIRLFENVDTPNECEMLLQVHDSVVFKIKKGLEFKYLPMIKEQMENIPEPFGVKFAVDIHKWGSEESWSPECAI